MGNLIKNHWARLVVLVAAAVQIGGSIEGFFWPKVTWDVFTTSLNIIVKPIPILQIINLVLGILVLAWEWPLGFLAGTMVHRSIHARFVVFAICIITSTSLYQSHGATVYYLMGIYGYASALAAHETIYPEPWTIDNTDEVPFLKPVEDPEMGLKDTSLPVYETYRKNSIQTSEYESSLALVPSTQSRGSRPSITFQGPIAENFRPLPEATQEKNSRPYTRKRAKTWHK